MFKKYRKFFFIFWGLVVIGTVSIVILFVLIANGSLGTMPAFEELENPNNKFASEIYYEDATKMGQYFNEENRKFIEYKDIPQNVVDALISTEDARFYEHSGIDVRGLFRVAKGLLTGDESTGGGSTLSQQLAKMLFPREAHLNKFQLVIRKLREWVIAVRLERSYTKQEIIAMYLNKYDFLNLAVGISSAADIYFQVPVDSLTLEQSAMLVGMAKNSSYFNPVRRPELTRRRRNVVFSQMEKYDKITKDECDSLKKLPLNLNFKRVDHKRGSATYFREYLRMYMTSHKPVEANYIYDKDQYTVDLLAWENDPLYGWCSKNKKADGSEYNIYTDGLKIYTTINSKMQKYAEDAMTEHLGKDLQATFKKEEAYKLHPPFSNDLTKSEIDHIMKISIRRTERYKAMKTAGSSEAEINKVFAKRRRIKIFTWNGVRDTIMSPVDSIKYYKSFFRAGFMVMQPTSGKIKAYVGGPDYRYFMYDMVSRGKRQVGSTIKPILYTLAMQEGLSPCDKVPNIPQTFILPDGTAWTSRSSSKHIGEMVTLKWGLANSVNNISAWVLKQFTPEAVVQMAHKMGITSYMDPVPSIFLGTSEISVREMVAAFSIFPNKGVYNSPLAVTEIKDKYGNILAHFYPKSKEVITERTAYLMCDLLKNVVDHGTGIRLRYKYQLTAEMGGKTGTTQAHSDGWFMGITPELVGGVWVGAEDRSIHFQTIYNGQGANMALPIWAIFLKKCYADSSLHLTQAKFEAPLGMDINLDCDDSKNDTKDEEEINKKEKERFF